MARYNVGSKPHQFTTPYKVIQAWEETELPDDELPAWEWIPLDDAAEKAVAVAISVHEYKQRLQQHSAKQIGDPAGDVVSREWVKDKVTGERKLMEMALPFPDDDYIKEEFWPKPASKRAKKLIEQRKTMLERELGAHSVAPTLSAQVDALVARAMAHQRSQPEPIAMSEVETKAKGRRTRAADQEPA